MVKIGIIGKGIVGLSTATALLEQHPDSIIVFYCLDNLTSLPSYGAAGVFRPDPSLMPGVKCCTTLKSCCRECPFMRWCSRSKDHYWKTAAGTYSCSAGVYFEPLWELCSSLTSSPSFAARICGAYRYLAADEVHALGFSDEVLSGYAYTTCMVEGRFHMPYLESKLLENSRYPIELHTTTIKSIGDLHKRAIEDHLDVVVNCSGLGSSLIFKDECLLPVRGSLVRVKASWMKFGFFGPNDTYAYSGIDCTILGGNRDVLPSPLVKPPATSVGDEHEAYESILQRIDRLWSAPLATSPVLEKWTGYRPYRDILRLELAWLCGSNDSRQVPVVHNYGHGSMGVALSWGTALDAVYLVEQSMKVSGTNPKVSIPAPGMKLSE